MNLTEWILASAVVLLFLRCEVLSHVIGVLRKDVDRAVNHLRDESGTRYQEDGRLHRRLNRHEEEFLVEKAVMGKVLDRLDKLDPPRRRATDKKAAKR